MVADYMITLDSEYKRGNEWLQFLDPLNCKVACFALAFTVRIPETKGQD